MPQARSIRQPTLFLRSCGGAWLAANTANLHTCWPNRILSDYACRWLCLLIITGMVTLWLAALHVSVEFASIVPKLQFAGLFLIFSAVFTTIGKSLPRVQVPFAVVSDL